MGLPTGGCASVTGIGGVVLQGGHQRLWQRCCGGVYLGRQSGEPDDSACLFLWYGQRSYVGQNLGARKMDRIQAGVRKSVVICIVICVALGLVEILFGEYLVANFCFRGRDGSDLL